MPPKTLKFYEGELSTHRFLDSYYIYGLIAHVFNELPAAAIVTEAPQVPK